MMLSCYFWINTWLSFSDQKWIEHFFLITCGSFFFFCQFFFCGCCQFFILQAFQDWKSLGNTLASLCMHAKSLQSFPTLCDPMDCALQTLSMGFSRQEYWSGLQCPPPGIKPCLLGILRWQAGSPLAPPGKPCFLPYRCYQSRHVEMSVEVDMHNLLNG